MKKILISITGFLIAGVLLSVSILGYLGFVPGVSALFGSDKPRNLGITYTEADRGKAYEKNGVIAAALPKTKNIADSIRYEGKKEVSFTMTNAEITALINSSKWEYMPISELQINIHTDGVAEASGILHIDKIVPYIS
jgi:hypothetical protein